MGKSEAGRDHTATTPLLIMRAAETLFLERGLGAVSLREIALAAKQRNPAAVAYHFGDKEGLVNAILERHSRPIQEGWLATLTHLDACQQTASLLELCQLLVRPTVAKLDDADGGRAYLSICATLATSTTQPLIDTPSGRGAGAQALGRRMMVLIGRLPPPVAVLRMTRVATVLYASIHDYQLLSHRGLSIARDVFVDDLVACIAAIVRPSI